MRHTVLIMVLAAACGSSQPPPAATPVALVSDHTAEQLDRVMRRLDALEQQMLALEERLGESEERQAAREERATEDAEEFMRQVREAAPAPAPPPAAPIPAAPPPAPRPGRPDPALTSAVPADGHPFEGPAHAKVTIVEAREFACPYCDKVRGTIAQLLADYPGTVKVVYRNMVVHPQVATLPAQAACAAHQQGRYVDMANAIYDKGFNQGRDLSRTKMEALAADLGLDLGKFISDMDNACVAYVTKDQGELAKFGVNATPTFFINGRHLSGAQPIDAFKAVIDEELKLADQRIRGGTKLRDYYKKWIVGRGRKTIP
jgi:protein-disulfide isomerase